MNHTPTPFVLHNLGKCIVIDGQHRAVCRIEWGDASKIDELDETNAAFIVKACNEHEALNRVAKFSKHNGNCHLLSAFSDEKTKCSCGLDDALVALTAIREEAK